MPELLLEILSEEIPARMQPRAADDLKRLVTNGLKDAGLEFSRAEAFATPRRLALVVEGLPLKAEGKKIERRGPKVGAPEKAIQGFLQSIGLESVEQAEIRETDRGAFYFHTDLIPGLPTARAVIEAIDPVLEKFPWPKSMRWGSGNANWVRPIHNILAIFDGEIIGADFNLVRTAGNVISPQPGTRIEAGNQTYGHRFMAPKPLAVKDFADYREKLRNAYVILDAGERTERMLADADERAEAEGLKLRNDPALAAEVAGLVEWPVALMGRIDDAFMDLPPEVLTESMRAHQKYFALETKGGALAPRFIVIANTETGDGGKAVIAGNERVLRARLADARFFWDQDRREKLESRVARLREITFHARLGTVAEKTDRMESLAAELSAFIPGCDRNAATRAAHLSKADLVTGMVGEFPELQGVMGRYYALHDGESAEVADAIAEHYAPKGPNDRCPTAPVSVAVALADKIDSLVGFFAIDEKPTGSRDPFALRRAALGVIRIVTENRLRLPLYDVIQVALRLHSFHGTEDWMQSVAAAAAKFEAMEEGGTGFLEPGAEIPIGKYVAYELLSFFADRLKVQMREQGVRHDLIEAVFATPRPEGGREDDLVRLLSRVDALTALLGTEDGANLLTAYRRAANIVAIEEKKDKATHDGAVDAELLREPEEKRLNDMLREEESALEGMLAGEKYGDAMAALASLRGPVDAFFDRVTVNCDDARLRANRLRLLSRIRAALNRVADFSRVEG